jgi:UDP-N-acetylmuramoylalanine--D-glutamate ligase
MEPMIAIAACAARSLAVFGLGASGLAAARALIASGARIAAWDDDAGRREAARAEGVPIEDLYRSSWSGFEALVLSPGIPLTHPAPHKVVALANAAGCPVVGDIELFCDAEPAATVIAVTGTNGKSTTTALIGHVLAESGRRVQLGGNLGTPALALDPLPRDGAYALELSSYQLDLCRDARFDVAVLVNVSPDHLDRHGGMAGYVAAKTRIFRPWSRADAQLRPVAQAAIIGIDDAYGAAIRTELEREGARRVVPISAARTLERGVYVAGGILHDATDGTDRTVADLNGIPTLPGAHNWQNAAAAYAAAREAGTASEDIAEAMQSFPGLPHRQEHLVDVAGVRFVNDSKATNGDSAARALACYDAIYWIAGGLAKDDGLGPAANALSRVRRAYLIGKAAPDFARALAGKVETRMSGDLATAVRQAFEDARRDAVSGAVVLLSPACASFDQFANFEARGEAFRREVLALAVKEAS